VAVGSIDRRVRAGQVSWQARWRDPAGQQHKRSFRRKVDAERFLIGVESAKAGGNYVEPQAGRTTLGDWSKTWLAGRVHLKPKTVAGYESLLRTRLLPMGQCSAGPRLLR
jgi:hypothetical protein